MSSIFAFLIFFITIFKTEDNQTTFGQIEVSDGNRL
ncbi:unnamed protein product [Haemonchus placei]|uniref:Uncharacterized protein n=1 Tax=Haemonchus placei TaxID=6290 RepID=A0A0N4XAH5_HAEPC|nr:unnamed protein product [Haemonchus placei]